MANLEWLINDGPFAVRPPKPATTTEAAARSAPCKIHVVTQSLKFGCDDPFCKVCLSNEQEERLDKEGMEPCEGGCGRAQAYCLCNGRDE